MDKKRVLVIEDSVFFGSIIKKKLTGTNGYAISWAQSKEEAIIMLNKKDHGFLAGIVDYNLPDAPNGEAIDELTNRGIPAIVFTGQLSEEVRNVVWSKDVADYVLKDEPYSIEYILNLLHRIKRNSKIKVLVVDDTSFFRKVISELLMIHRYRVLTAENGEKALNIISQHPDIKLVITDYNMPVMDGFKLTHTIREKISRENMAIIGISSEGEQMMAARFIKHGANDFIIKQNFLTEEFYGRVNQCIENLENIEKVKNASIKDFLTGLYNRRYFFDTGTKLFSNAKRKNINLACGMLDIDYFKKVNDTYGHDAGDLALIAVSEILTKRMRETDILARMGGEEFCILTVNADPTSLADIFEYLRKTIENTPVNIGNGTQINITVSIGVTTQIEDNLDGMIKVADEQLYAAKQSGRNRIMLNN
ncbi:MAG: diguanylate cyclase [Desulfobulbaceae bacterium]|nr:diguanylate cyclase [Desulfobulbaceae bacterium]